MLTIQNGLLLPGHTVLFWKSKIETHSVEKYTNTLALGTIFWKLRFPVPRIQIAGGANSALMRPKLPFYKEAN